MDKPVMFVRVLGASPLTSKQEVKEVMEQYGEVIEVKKGLLSKKLPHVTNGTWNVRMIVGVDKTIPSFVFVRDDGEFWQLAHDSQVTICWKCGRQGHIGSRCNEQAVSIDTDLVAGVQADGVAEEAPVQTWAHVVRRGAGHQVPEKPADKDLTVLSQKAEEAKAATEKEAKTKAEAKAVREAQAKAANIAKAANDRKAEALAKAAKEKKAAEADLAVKDIESEKAEIERMAITEIEDGAVDALNKTNVLVLSASSTAAAELDSGDSLVKPPKLSKNENGKSGYCIFARNNSKKWTVKIIC